MTTLVIARGLPASGKSTWAKAWVAEDPTRRARVNKDDLRKMMHNGVYLGYTTEYQINLMRDTMIYTMLMNGFNVVSDDTNLPKNLVEQLTKIGEQNRATVVIQDFTDVPVEECIRRDANRDDSVGEEVIYRLAADARREDAES